MFAKLTTSISTLAAKLHLKKPAYAPIPDPPALEKVDSNSSSSTGGSIASGRGAIFAVKNAVHAAKYFVWPKGPVRVAEDHYGWGGWTVHYETVTYRGHNPFRRKERTNVTFKYAFKHKMDPITFRFLTNQARFRERFIRTPEHKRGAFVTLPKHKRARDYYERMTGKQKMHYSKVHWRIKATKGRNRPTPVKKGRYSY